MKYEYNYLRVDFKNANTVINDAAKTGWRVINFNRTGEVVDVLLERLERRYREARLI